MHWIILKVDKKIAPNILPVNILQRKGFYLVGNARSRCTKYGPKNID